MAPLKNNINLRKINLEKLTSTEIYSLLILKLQSKLSSNIYFENLFNSNDIDCAAIYMLPRLVLHNSYMRPTTKHHFKNFMNVTVLNINGRT